MPTFAEFVAESFHSEANLNWNLAGSNYVTATFAVDEINVVVSFEQREHNGPWHVVFEVEQSDSTAAVHSSFEIFNGVLQAVTEFVQVREPDIVVFATKKDKLANIYQTYLRRESATLEKLGYTLEGPHRVDPFMEFVLRREKPSNWKP
jgi:hypothetical protein